MTELALHGSVFDLVGNSTVSLWSEGNFVTKEIAHSYTHKERKQWRKHQKKKKKKKKKCRDLC